MPSLRRLILRGIPVLCLATASIALTHPAHALEGTVVRVSDGDTFWLRSSRGQRPHRVRLDGIDAPELCQEGGRDARLALESLVMGRRVTLRERATDRYGRRIAQALQGSRDVAEQLVLKGWAWSTEFRGKPGPYAASERAARNRRVGVFAKEGAMAPWLFRQQHGSCFSPLDPPTEPDQGTPTSATKTSEPTVRKTR